MLNKRIMKEAMQSYIDGFNNKDSDLIISLFSDNAKIEDPVGSGNVVRGKLEITSFYETAVKMVDKVELILPIHGYTSHFGAMAFKIFMNIDGNDIEIDTIDVMTFDYSGKIISMKAFHGAGEVID